jgi:hypothetical protein
MAVSAGISLEDLRSRFGAPTEVEGARVVFVSNGRTLRATLGDGRLTAFEIERTL